MGSYEKEISNHERKIHVLRDMISFRDRYAITAYNESQSGLHNLHSRAWGELSEEKQNEWREKVGTERV